MSKNRKIKMLFINRVVSPHPSAILRQQTAVGFQPTYCTFFKLVVLRDSSYCHFSFWGTIPGCLLYSKKQSLALKLLWLHDQSKYTCWSHTVKDCFANIGFLKTSHNLWQLINTWKTPKSRHSLKWHCHRVNPG